ncbi:MAG: NAD(+)/NADH kinase [Campylobacterota bacterium]|nr:NAD(+)/NADH kinase [Campylobacterota bacterium]
MRNTPSNQTLSKIEKVGIIFKPSSFDLKNTYLEIIENIKAAQLEIFYERNSAKLLNLDGYDFDYLCKTCDILISLGGDGTLISVSRRSCKYEIPVLGVNLGTLGFLTDIMPQELPKFLDNLKSNNYRIDARMMIEATANLNSFIAFNDFVITRKNINSMVRIDAKIDGKQFNTYHGDGLIISTPTGSTAYNLSTGGPVVYPLTEAFVVTPISPHSLTQRPLVLPGDFEIELSTPDKQGAVMIMDGQDIYNIEQHEIIKIKVAQHKARLLHRLERNYFSVLNEKLHWGH